MQSISIVKAAGNPCRGEHANPEMAWNRTIEKWEHTDARASTPVIEVVERLPDETPEAFSVRVSSRADVVDRELACPRCYR